MSSSTALTPFAALSKQGDGQMSIRDLVQHLGVMSRDGAYLGPINAAAAEAAADLIDELTREAGIDQSEAELYVLS